MKEKKNTNHKAPRKLELLETLAGILLNRALIIRPEQEDLKGCGIWGQNTNEGWGIECCVALSDQIMLNATHFKKNLNVSHQNSPKLAYQ